MLSRIERWLGEVPGLAAQYEADRAELATQQAPTVADFVRARVAAQRPGLIGSRNEDAVAWVSLAVLAWHFGADEPRLVAVAKVAAAELTAREGSGAEAAEQLLRALATPHPAPEAYLPAAPRALLVLNGVATCVQGRLPRRGKPSTRRAAVISALDLLHPTHAGRVIDCRIARPPHASGAPPMTREVSFGMDDLGTQAVRVHAQTVDGAWHVLETYVLVQCVEAG